MSSTDPRPQAHAALHAPDQEAGPPPSGERRLALAILEAALAEALGPGRQARDARAWIASSSRFLFWCAVAGLPPSAFRAALSRRLAAAARREPCPAAAESP